MSTRGTGDAGNDWAELFVGIEALAARPSIRRAWLRGLSDVAPPDTLVRLLGVVDDLVVRRSLPAAVVDAAIARPERGIRLHLAEFQREMSVDQWVRLIAGEPGEGLRRRFRALAVWHCPKVTEPEFARWAGDSDPRIRVRALWFRGLPQRLSTALTADPDPEVRAEACAYAWARLDASRRSALVDDPAPQVREVARAQADFDRPMSRVDFDALTSTEQWHVARSQVLDRGLAEHLVHHPEYGLRMSLLDNERLDADLLAVPARDEDFRVRVATAAHPRATEALRTAIGSGLPPGTAYWRVGWVEELHDDPEAMRRLAASASVAIRRGVARARRLPPDVLDLLSHDPDPQVPALLAQFCEDAPADLLLEVAVRHQNHPVTLLARPNFPRHTLLGFADDPDPLRRRLALDAPDSTGELAERLADDPDEPVRARAAADPRLSPATVLRLLDSTPVIRRAAIGNPRLPVPALVRLLRDPETAEAAAGNPALPTAVVHRLIDLACPPE